MFLAACAAAVAAPPAPAPTQLELNADELARKIALLPPHQAYDSAFQAWSDGKQRAAEGALERLVKRHPDDQRLAFFLAACQRGRFDVSASRQSMDAVVKINPSTPRRLREDGRPCTRRSSTKTVTVAWGRSTVSPIRRSRPTFWTRDCP